MISGSYQNTGSDRAVSYVVNVSCDACLGGEPYSNSFAASTEELYVNAIFAPF